MNTQNLKSNNNLFSKSLLNQLKFSHLKLDCQSSSYSTYKLTGNGHGPLVEIDDGSVKYDLSNPCLLGMSHPLLIKDKSGCLNFKESDYNDYLNELNRYLNTDKILGVGFNSCTKESTNILQLFSQKMSINNDTTYLSPSGNYITLHTSKVESVPDKSVASLERGILNYLIKGQFFDNNGRIANIEKKLLLSFSDVRNLSFTIKGENITNQLFKNGIICSYFDEKNIFKLPLSITNEHIDEIISIINKEKSAT